MTSENAGSTTPAPALDAARRERHHLGAPSWPFWRGLLGQVGSVLADLPLFLTAPLYRQRHLRWGSTNDEVASAMPGDATLPNAQFVSTRSITINAQPAAVWPWRLTPTTSGGTRLVTRIHAVYDWAHPWTAILGVILMEFGDFAMMRRMLRGIKTRAEVIGDDL